MHKRLHIFTDGGARGNPGPAAVGVVIKFENTETVIAAFGKKIGETTNNVAEYTAVIEALRFLVGEKVVALSGVFHLDSQLVVSQIMGRFKVKQPHLQALLLQVKNLLTQASFPLTFIYIPREQNTAADALVNKALDASSKSL